MTDGKFRLGVFRYIVYLGERVSHPTRGEKGEEDNKRTQHLELHVLV